MAAPEFTEEPSASPTPPPTLTPTPTATPTMAPAQETATEVAWSFLPAPTLTSPGLLGLSQSSSGGFPVQDEVAATPVPSGDDVAWRVAAPRGLAGKALGLLDSALPVLDGAWLVCGICALMGAAALGFWMARGRHQ